MQTFRYSPTSKDHSNSVKQKFVCKIIKSSRWLSYLPSHGSAVCFNLAECHVCPSCTPAGVLALSTIWRYYLKAPLHSLPSKSQQWVAYHILDFFAARLALKVFTISSMKGSVERYWSGVTLVVPWTQMARSCRQQHNTPRHFLQPEVKEVYNATTRCRALPRHFAGGMVHTSHGVNEP